MVFCQWLNNQTSKGSDQTARMRRLVGGFAVRTYHIVGNLMHWLIIIVVCNVFMLLIDVQVIHNEILGRNLKLKIND